MTLPPSPPPSSRHNDLETKVPIRNIQYCIASSKYMTYELVSKTCPEFLHARILDRCRQSRMDALVMDVRYRCRYNEIKRVINFYLIWICYILCYVNYSRKYDQKGSLYFKRYHFILFFFFFQVKLSFRQFVKKTFSLSLPLGFSPLFAVSFTLSRVVGRDKKQRQRRVQQNFTG